MKYTWLEKSNHVQCSQIILIASVYKPLSIHLYFVCLHSCFFLYPINLKKAESIGTSRDPREGLWMIEFLKICLNKFDFWKFWKSAKSFYKIGWNFVCFVLICIQRENVHNWNRRWVKSESQVLKYFKTILLIWFCLSLFKSNWNDF